MAFLGKFAGFIVVLAVVLAALFKTNVDVRHTMCLLGSLGYLDFLGNEFLDGLTQCLAETSTHYLKRDFKYGDGKIAPIHTIDCSDPSKFSFEKFAEETQNFTRPVLCKGLLKNNKCRQWDLDYFDAKSPSDELFRVQELKEIEGNRRAFMRYVYPQFTLTKNETFSRMKQGDQLYISFDNYFITKKPELVADMDLNQYFGPTNWILHTLFISNFTQSTLGSPFHAAPNDNFFFQCRGRKHWYYISPHDLHYVSAYVANGVTFVSNYINEDEIVKRITIHEAIIEEGDMMYNPPFWMHAVGTLPGLTISVANRVFRKFVPEKTNVYFDAIYKIGFPAFISSIAWQKFVSKFPRINSLTLQNEVSTGRIDGGALPVLKA